MDITVQLDIDSKSFLNKITAMIPKVRDDIEKSMARGAIMIQDKAKEILTEIEWTAGEHGLRRYGGGSTLKEYFEAGETVIGHIDTGNLRRNIKSDVAWTGDYEITAVIGTDVPYAIYVEALPDGGFLYRAVMEKSPDALKYIENELKKIFI